MSNKGVTFLAGGASYSLHLGMSAMVRFEALSGENAFAVAQELQTRLEDRQCLIATKLGQLFFAALTPRVDTLDDALGVMDEIGPTAAMALLGRAIDEAYSGVAEGAAEANPPKRSKRSR